MKRFVFAAVLLASPLAAADDPVRLTLPTESDRAAWTTPGFRIALGAAYGRLAGLAQYRLTDPGLIVFIHTEIDDAFEGRGLGSILVRAALDAARSRGLAVRPDCPFVRGYIARHPEYLDLVPADLRPRFGL